MGNNNSVIVVPKKNFGSIKPGENGTVRPGYYFGKGVIVYKGNEIMLLPNEDSLKRLGNGYLKTNLRVFYKGEVIENVLPKTFQVINRNKVKDHVTRKELIDLDSVLGMDIIGTTKRFYYRGNLIHSE
jgi:hypothetical protein